MRATHHILQQRSLITRALICITLICSGIAAADKRATLVPVSYTHLTLPTNREV